MQNTFIKFVSAVIILAFSSCASVKFYSDSGLSKKSGLKYYTVKPYLQVERDPVSNSIVKATVLYLPDIENPQYLLMNAGAGSNKLDLKLAEGSINTFGVDSDTKIVESITALTGLISKTITAIADLATLKGVPPTAAPSTVTELYDIIMSGGVTSVKRIEIR